MSFKMNPEVKAKWLKALRSGEYRQGKGFLLRRDAKGKDRFCCLGVLCNLYAQEHPGTGFKFEPAEEMSPFRSQLKPGEQFFSFSENAVSLPPEVREWSSMPNFSEPEVEQDYGMGPQSILAEMNDDGSSFKKIARWIEKWL